ncbi:MAG: RHS repeat-associated core domain-containing protein [Acidobacteria bacterium]|nr:RHS repeat-associated core domain-containing protein [Acidobacteriota bacterium]
MKYSYDGVAYLGCASALSTSNSIGRRTAMCDGAGQEAWSYDITTGVGWKTTDRRTTNSVTKDFVYQNNLDGSLATLSYPNNRVVTYAYNAAGRALSAVDTANSINYALNASYAPQGALSSLQNGASIVSTFYYNNRLQPCRISVRSAGVSPANCADTANTGNVLDFTYGFNLGTANNGNVASIANSRDIARSQSFTYDELNRIKTAQTQATAQPHCWGEIFTYDIWANLLTIGGIQPQYNGCTQESLSVGATTKNQISGYTYDAAGNLINNPGVATYSYDAENRMTTTAGVTYTYDGDGRRVKKSNGKLYWYGSGSDALEETDLSGTATADFVFFNGKRTARMDLPSATVHYYFANHLGSANVVTSSTGVIQDESDYYPFGGERSVTDTDPNQYKFTGKERDTESGLDYFIARYDASSLGRFMSPDPENAGAMPDDPQSWNAYTYARNNPLIYTDPDGTEYRLCDTKGNCAANYSDTEFDKNFENDRSVELRGKEIYKNGKLIGTFERLSFDDLSPSANAFFNQMSANRRPMNRFIGTFAVSSVVVGATGGAACYFLCPSATVTTLGITVGPTLAPLVINPRLQQIVNTLFQVTDRLPGGTAGVTRVEQMTGELFSKAGHAQKAEDSIIRLNNVIRSGQLSAQDRAVAGKLIQDLRTAIDTKRAF